MPFTISDLFFHLTRSTDSRFYALLLNCFQRIPDERIPTMTIAVLGDKLILRYSPSFVNSLSFNMGCFIVKHEALHVMLEHIPRKLTLLAKTPQREHEELLDLSRYATDMAVNSLLQQDPLWSSVAREFQGILPEQWGLPSELAYETYLELLKRLPPSKRNAEQLLTSHDAWVPEDDQTAHEPWQGVVPSEELENIAERLRAQIKGAVRKAVKGCGRNGIRGLPPDIGTLLDQYLTDPMVPWWQVFATRIQSSRQMKPVRSLQQPNRKLLALAEEDPTIIPALGTAYDPSYRILKVIDVSGSMSDEMVRLGFNETRAMMTIDPDIEVRVIQGTDEIVADKLYRGDDQLEWNRAAYGGTDFNAYFEYIWKHHLVDPEGMPDIVVVYTDGGTAHALRPELYLPPEIPVIWLISPDGHGEPLEWAGYGEVINTRQ